MSQAIQIQNLRVHRKEKCICQLDKLTISKGERISVQGLNGSGKSTLLRVISGLESNYNGEVSIPDSFQPIGFVQQNPFLFRGTVLSNLMYGTRGRSLPKVSELANTIADKLDIADLLERRASNLSGGERRRVALARTMILSPSLLLLDEPFADMDQQGLDATCQYLNSLHDTTILIATPNPLPELPFTPRLFTIE